MKTLTFQNSLLANKCECAIGTVENWIEVSFSVLYNISNETDIL